VIALAIVGRDGGFPVACYRAAAEKLRTIDPRKRTRSYFLTVVAGFERDGLPDPAPPRGVRVDPGHGTPALPPRLAAIERQRIKAEEIKRARKEATDGESV
jgi:hypothetical protein